MTTGWKYVRDDGEEFKSAQAAAQSLALRPGSTFEHSELDMSGVRRRDATEEIAALLSRMTAVWPARTCPEDRT